MVNVLTDSTVFLTPIAGEDLAAGTLGTTITAAWGIALDSTASSYLVEATTLLAAASMTPDNSTHQILDAILYLISTQISSNPANVPINGIIEYSGSVSSIPNNWHLCDGTNGTPDLRGKFVIGAGGTYEVGAVGGSASSAATTEPAGSHTHSGNTGAHALTTNEMPQHNHPVNDPGHNHPVNDPGHTHGLNGNSMKPTPDLYCFPNIAVGPGWNAVNGTSTVSGTGISIAGAGTGVSTANTGSSWGHDHTISTDGNHVHTLTSTSLPPYYALCKIMRIS